MRETPVKSLVLVDKLKFVVSKNSVNRDNPQERLEFININILKIKWERIGF